MEFIKKIVRPIRNWYVHSKKKRKFKQTLVSKNNSSEELKIVVGSFGIHQEGWIPTERYFLNLLIEEDWALNFNADSISNIFAEHVWEHLTLEQGKKAIQLCHKFLMKYENLRMAIDDGLHTDSDYMDYVKI